MTNKSLRTRLLVLLYNHNRRTTVLSLVGAFLLSLFAWNLLRGGTERIHEEADDPLTVLANAQRDRLDAQSSNPVDVMLKRLKPIALPPGPEQAHFYSDFRSFSAIARRVRQFADKHASRVVVGSIGQTAGGVDIPAIRLSGRGTGPNHLPNVLVVGTEHGREWTVPMSLLYAVEQLLGSSEDGGVLDHCNLWVVPILNVDGYKYTWTSPSDPEVRFWRKNRQPNDDGTIGTDLNRNWGTNGLTWGFGQTWTDSEVYMGSAPFSAVETSLVRRWIDGTNKSGRKDSRMRAFPGRQRALVSSFVALHCCIGSVLQTRNLCTVSRPIERLHGVLGRGLSQTMNAVGHGVYNFSKRRKTLTISSSGVSVDWAFYDMRIPYPYLIETSISKRAKEEARENKAAVLDRTKSTKQLKAERKERIREKMSTDTGDDIVPVGKEVLAALVRLGKVFERDGESTGFPPLGFDQDYYQCREPDKTDLTPNDPCDGTVDAKKPWISCHKEGKSGKGRSSRKGSRKG